jgi:hypothetical protein
MPSAWAARNCDQVGPERLGAGTQPMGSQKAAGRRGADADPELAQLALDPDVAPPRVLPGEAQDDVAELRSTRGRPSFDQWYVHLRRTSSRCQRSNVWGLTMSEVHRFRGKRRADAARNARSIGRNDGRPT